MDITDSVIYCDPPYQGTTKYKDDFDHDEFWNWCRKMNGKGNKIYVSEYHAPDDFKCIWQKTINNSLSSKCRKAVERLYTI